ncbi:MAG: hypothetical protein ACRBCL_08200 [Maritimibacter sp.]
MNKDWEVFLTTGIGKAKFGISQKEFDAFSETYGKVFRSISFDDKEQTAEEFRDFLEEFDLDDLLLDEEIESAVKQSNEINLRFKGVIDERRLKEFIIAVEYNNGVFYSATTDGHNDQVHHEGLRIFSTDAKKLLQHFQNLNGGAKVHETDVLFDKIGILLTGHYYQNEQGSWRFYREGDSIFEDRFVTVFDPLYIGRYLTDGFVEVDFRQK